MTGRGKNFVVLDGESKSNGHERIFMRKDRRCVRNKSQKKLERKIEEIVFVMR